LDHLQNHGFLLTANVWVLSPAYDIKPVETGNGLSLNFSEKENALDFDFGKGGAPYFPISKTRGEEIIAHIKIRFLAGMS
jgi:serine/threonine-protein kinase HipA